MDTFSYPTLSVVIEWENARNAKKARGAEMLRRLFAQLTAINNCFPAAPEVVVVHDTDDGSAEQILAEVAGKQPSVHFLVRTCPCADLDYYDQKNLGAREARGEVILFVDSDVIPEDGWLKALLDCYVEEGCDAVAGATYIHGQSLYDRAFALFWFFPTEGDCRALSRGQSRFFFANNVLFRAAAFHPYPEAPLVRTRWSLLADLMLKSGQSIIFEPRARTRHPAPNGVKHFVYRALCEGQDCAQYERPWYQKFLSALRRLGANMARSSTKIAAGHRDVGLNWPGTLGAMVIAFTYYGFAFCGEVVTVVFPNLIRQNLRV